MAAQPEVNVNPSSVIVVVRRSQFRVNDLTYYVVQEIIAPNIIISYLF